MIINNTHRFVFVHVPKAAGTSVTTFLSTLTRWCDIELGGTQFGEDIQNAYRQRFRLYKHSTVFEIRAVIGEELWEKYFTFGFVRNPYERALSAYHTVRWLQQDQQIESHSILKSLDTFPKFVASDYFWTPGIDRILQPQLFWLKANRNSEQLGVKYVGTVENLVESLRTIAKHIAPGNKPLELQTDLPAKNESDIPGSAVWHEMNANPGLEEALYRRYEPDFRIFAYPRYHPKQNP